MLNCLKYYSKYYIYPTTHLFSNDIYLVYDEEYTEGAKIPDYIGQQYQYHIGES